MPLLRQGRSFCVIGIAFLAVQLSAVIQDAFGQLLGHARKVVPAPIDRREISASRRVERKDGALMRILYGGSARGLIRHF